MLNRRNFFERIAATSVAAAIPFDFPLDSPPAVGIAADQWDLSWVTRLRGQSRAVFDSPDINDGVALFRAVLWRQQVNEVLGNPKEELTPVVVFRHRGIVLIMNDEYWDRYEVGKKAKAKDEETGKWYKKNPIASASEKAPAPFNEISLPRFMETGGIALACGLAFQQVVGTIRKKDKVDGPAARDRARRLLIPGVILQPSGFFAVLKAQEEGCNYMMGS